MDIVEVYLLFFTLLGSLTATCITFYFSRKSNKNQIESQVYTNFFQLLDHKENLLSSENVYLSKVEEKENRHTEARAISILVKKLFEIDRDKLETMNNPELNHHLNSKIFSSKIDSKSYNHKGIVNFKIYKYHKTIMSYLYGINDDYKYKLIDIYFDTMTIREKAYYLICDKNISESDIINFKKLNTEITLEELDKKFNKKLREYFHL